MKKLLLLLFLGFALVGFSQTTLIPDPNFEQALIDLGYDTAPINGSVPTANISSVTDLSVGGRNIADLTGIEDFTALTILGVVGNQLTSLDVSNNTALTSLGCNQNQLTSLDVTNNTALFYLDCEDNQLTSLDARNVNNEGINNDTFWARNNPNLTCIYVDDADYSNANWLRIDPASTFVETEAECEALSVEDNALGLDVFIYPNPTDNYLFIEGKKNPVSISIYNLLGAEVIATSSTDKINVSELSKGVYIIRISDGVNQTNKRFIKN